MDWTGGTRKRFAAGRNNATLQKQKAHFAKARAAVHTTANSQPGRRPGSKRSARSRGLAQAFVSGPEAYAPSNNHDDPRHGQKHGYAHRAESFIQLQRESRSKTGQHRRALGGRFVGGPVHVSSRSSCSSLSKHPTGRDKSHKLSKQSHGEPRAISNDDKLLLAQRRHLLARADWLGLSVKRPAQIAFASTGDEEDVGKRRRVKTPAQRCAIAAMDRREVLPAPQRLHNDYTMDGPLLGDGVEIRIGTDAFASHTQQSRRSQNSRPTSMRPPSTDVELLSEESMLLESEDGVFVDYYGLPDVQYDAITPAFQGMVAGSPRINESLEYVQNIPDNACMMERTAFEEAFRQESPDIGAVIAVSNTSIVPEPTYSPVLQRGQYCIQQVQLTDEKGDVQYDDGHNATDDEISTAQDEDRWRRLAGVEYRESSHASVAAVRSSSLHLTESNGSSHLPPLLEQLRESTHQDNWSTPKGAGTQASVLNLPQEFIEDRKSCSMLQSPSASLKQITMLAKQPRLPDRREQEAQNDDELWKAFIIGSQSGSPPATPRFAADRATLADIDSPEWLSPPAPSAALSGFETSNHSTAGDTSGSKEIPTKGSPSMQPLRIRPQRPHLAVTLQHNRALAAPQRVSGDEDDIEEVNRKSPQRQGKCNIHAETILNPNRFKRRPRQALVPKKPAEYRSSRRPARQSTKQERSVYDLVDSDGRSLEDLAD